MTRRDETPRDLLFGLLALHTGLIDQDQLLAAFGAWSRAKGKTLAEILIERGSIDAESGSLLAGMAEKQLKLHGGDAEKSLAAVAAGPSTREKLAALGDADLTSSVALAGSHPPSQDATATMSVGTSTSDGQRFRVLRPYARGGLGAVYVALDGELNREVALKQILDHHADNPASRARFLIEAEITGGLEHPGIVPVYGLGHHSDGRPYYAMRFIRGDSLKEAIAAFHADESLGHHPGQKSLALRKLLRRFVDVCNAVDYAHGRGVLHRDLKPGNVIVGKHGETLVVDWGLAKPMGRPEVGSQSDERTLMPSSSSGSAETRHGTAIGTPAYMSPEQASGDLERLGPRSDVYSLGATLYCLLTGKPPFEGQDIGAILRDVQKGAFPPPHQLAPAIDRALEAVCLKAMSVKPEGRYATARALAEDVERWAADEPVSAYPEPLARRAGRWTRRNKTAVAGAACLLITAVVALAVGNVLIGRQKAKAEANFRLAREAVDEMYTQVAERWLAQEPQMEPLQREFLIKALRFYERFADPDDASAEMRREAGKAARRVGEIQQKLGEHASAEASFGRARQILGAMIGDDRAAQELAVTENRWGWFQWTLGRPPDDAFRRALALATVLIRRTPTPPESRKELARAYSSQGLVHAAYGRYVEAEAAHRRALALRQALVRDFPAVADYRQDLARTYANLATVLRQTGRFGEAEAESGRAVALVAELVTATPRDPHLRADLVHDLDERANLLALIGRPREAEALLERARDLADRLAADFRNSLNYQDLHSAVRRDLAILRRVRGQSQDAQRDLVRSIAVAEELRRRKPDVPNYRRTLAVHRANLGELLHSAGRPAEAEREYLAALKLAEELVADHPGVLDYRSLQCLYRSSLAFLRRATGRFPEAATAYGRVVADLEALAREFPGSPQFRASLASAYHRRGEVLGILKRWGEADASLDRAISLAESLAAESQAVPSYRDSAASALGTLAQLALDRHDTGRARRLHERAIPHLEAAFAADPESSGHRFLMLRATSALAQIQAHEGDYRAAEATARRIDELPRTPNEHYNAACFLALVVSAIRASTAPEADRAAPDRSLADRSLDHLRRALDLGYRNTRLIATDPDLDPLRSRPDFQLLMMDLAFPARPLAR